MCLFVYSIAVIRLTIIAFCSIPFAYLALFVLFSPFQLSSCFVVVLHMPFSALVSVVGKRQKINVNNIM